MKNLIAGAASAVLLAIATPCLAEYATGGSFIDNGTNFTKTVDDPTRLGAGDGLAFDWTGLDGFQLADINATFTAGATDLVLKIYTGTVTNVYLTGVAFTDGFGSAIWFGNPIDGLLAPNSQNTFVFDLGGAGTYGLLDVGYTGSYDTVTMTFGFDSIGDSLQVSAVENPEPGTIALFGLGALGLAGVVRRRRRKSATPDAART